MHTCVQCSHASVGLVGLAQAQVIEMENFVATCLSCACKKNVIAH